MTPQELRQAIAEGHIKPNQGNGSVKEGIFQCLVESAEIGPGESGNIRGKLVCRVIDAQDIANVGKKFNCYIQTVNAQFLEQSIAEYSEYCTVWGVPQDRIYDRAETLLDVAMNMVQEIQRLAVKNRLLAVIERVPSGKLDRKNRPTFWSNWKSVELAAAPIAAPAAPAPAAPAPAAPAPAAPAPAAPAPAAPAPAAKKPWQV